MMLGSELRAANVLRMHVDVSHARSHGVRYIMTKIKEARGLL
jgi:hypothetical protein